MGHMSILSPHTVQCVKEESGIVKKYGNKKFYNFYSIIMKLCQNVELMRLSFCPNLIKIK